MRSKSSASLSARQKRIFVLTAATGAVLAIGFWMGTESHRPNFLKKSLWGGSNNGAGLTSRELKELLPELLVYGMRPGRAYSYRFRRSLQLTSKGAGGPGPTGRPIEMEGELTVRVVQATGESISAIFSTTLSSTAGIELTQGASGSPEYSALAQFDRRGRLLDLRVRPSKNAAAERPFIADLVTGWLVALPEISRTTTKSPFSFFTGKGQGPYEVQGTDMQGHYSMSVALPSEPESPVALKMSKLQYLTAPIPTKVEASEGTVDWAVPAGRLQRLESHETLMLGPGTMDIQIERNSLFEYRSEADFAPDQLALREYTISATPEAVVLASSGNGGTDSRPALSWDELKRQLREAKDAQGRLRVFGDIVSSARKDEAVVRRISEEIRKTPTGNETYLMLVGSLGSAATPAAQAGLREIFADVQTNDRGRLLVLESFAMMDSANGDTRSFLADVLEKGTAQEQSTAALALGSSLRRSKEDQDDTGVSRAQRLLLKKWKAAGTDAERIDVLGAIGNSGDTYFLGILQNLVENGSQILKREAVYSMRFMDSDRPRKALLQLARGSGDEELRRQAFRALRLHHWDGDIREAARACTSNETSEDLQVECAGTLLGRPEERQATLAFLQSVSSGSSASPRLRSLVAAETR